MDRHNKEAFLVLRSQTGDRRALDALLKSVQTPLFRYIQGIVGDAASAEDVLQDVFVIVCRKIKWLREPTFFRAWTYRIASREAVHAARRERKWRDRIQDMDVLENESEPDEEARYEQELIDRLPALLDAVPPASRAVLLLHYQEELSLKTISDVLDVPVGTVKSRLAYGLRSMRTVIGAEIPSGNSPGTNQN